MKISFILILMFLSSRQLAAQGITNTVCNFGNRTYTKAQYAPTFGNNPSDLQNYFDSAFSKFEKTKSRATLTLIIDTVGKATVSNVYHLDPSIMGEKDLNEMISSMPGWNPGRMGNCNVNCAIGLDLVFDNKSVHVVYDKNQISPN